MHQRWWWINLNVSYILCVKIYNELILMLHTLMCVKMNNGLVWMLHITICKLSIYIWRHTFSFLLRRLSSSFWSNIFSQHDRQAILMVFRDMSVGNVSMNNFDTSDGSFFVNFDNKNTQYSRNADSWVYSSVYSSVNFNSVYSWTSYKKREVP